MSFWILFNLQFDSLYKLLFQVDHFIVSRYFEISGFTRSINDDHPFYVSKLVVQFLLWFLLDDMSN